MVAEGGGSVNFVEARSDGSRTLRVEACWVGSRHLGVEARWVGSRHLGLEARWAGSLHLGVEALRGLHVRIPSRRADVWEWELVLIVTIDCGLIVGEVVPRYGDRLSVGLHRVRNLC